MTKPACRCTLLIQGFLAVRMLASSLIERSPCLSSLIALFVIDGEVALFVVIDGEFPCLSRYRALDSDSAIASSWSSSVKRDCCHPCPMREYYAT
jgi:hypothetical protein